jgi:hypothetical protein
MDKLDHQYNLDQDQKTDTVPTQPEKAGKQEAQS